MIPLLLLRKRNPFTVLISNVTTMRTSLLRAIMLKMKITPSRKIMLMLNLCLVMVPSHSLLPPLPIHLLKLSSLSNLSQIFHPTKVLILFMWFPIVILKGYLLKKLKLTFTWLQILSTIQNLKCLSLHML